MASRAEAGEVAAPLARDVNVRLSEPLEIQPSCAFQGLAIANSLNLAAVITRQGMWPIETHTGYDLHHLDTLRATFQNADRNSCPRSQPFYSQSTGEHARLVSLSFVDHASRLLCGLSDGNLLLYDSAGQGTCRQIATPGPNLVIQQVKPNPGDRSDLCLVTFAANLDDCDTKKHGSSYILDVRTGNWLATLPVTGVTTAAWSTKGKQLVVGLFSGELVQFTPEGHEKARLPPPPDMDRPVYVEDVFWLENHVFLTTYNTQSEQLVHEYDVFVILRDVKAGHCTYAAFPLDVAPPFGDTSRIGQRYTAALRAWGQEKHLVFMASAPSTDVGVLGCNIHEVGPNSWNALELEDTSRPVLPFSSVDESTDTSPVGMQFDLTATESVEDPNAAAKGEDVEQNLPAMPILLVYTNDGVLLAYNVINTSTNEPYPGMIQGESSSSAPVTEVSMQETKSTEPVQDTTNPLNPSQASNPAQPRNTPLEQPSSSSAASAFERDAQAESTGPAFGSTSAFGTTAKSSGAPAFGSSSAFGSAAKPGSTPAFGSSSAFGSAAKSSDTPAFGSSSAFGSAVKPGSTPAFGSSSAFESTSTFGTPSAFGSASKPAPQTDQKGGFQAFGAGQSSFGNLSKSETANSSSTPAFASTQSNTNSAFGSVAKTSAFGSSSTSTPSAFTSSSGSSAFGSTANPSAFGTKSSFNSLQTSSDAPAFGKSAFGQPSAFGSTKTPSSSAFGGGFTSSPASTPNQQSAGFAFGKTSSSPAADLSKSAFASASGPSSAFSATANPESKSVFGSGGALNSGAPAFQNATKVPNREAKPAKDNQASSPSNKDTSAFSFSSFGSMLESRKASADTDSQGVSLQSDPKGPKNAFEKTGPSFTADKQIKADEQATADEQSSVAAKLETSTSEASPDQDAAERPGPGTDDQKTDSNSIKSTNEPANNQKPNENVAIESDEPEASSKDLTSAKDNQEQSRRNKDPNEKFEEDELSRASDKTALEQESQTANRINSADQQKQSPIHTLNSTSDSHANQSSSAEDRKLADTISSNKLESSKEVHGSKPFESPNLNTTPPEHGSNTAATALNDDNEQKPSTELKSDLGASKAETKSPWSNLSDNPKSSEIKPFAFKGVSNKADTDAKNDSPKLQVGDALEEKQQSTSQAEKPDGSSDPGSAKPSNGINSSASSSSPQVSKFDGFKQFGFSSSSSSNAFSFNSLSKPKPEDQKTSSDQNESGAMLRSEPVQSASQVAKSEQPTSDVSEANTKKAQSIFTPLDGSKSGVASNLTHVPSNNIPGGSKPSDDLKSAPSADTHSTSSAQSCTFANTQQTRNIPATKPSSFSFARPNSTAESSFAPASQGKPISSQKPTAIEPEQEIALKELKLEDIKLPAIRLPSLATPALSDEGDELQREFAKIYLSVNRELDALRIIAKDNSTLYHRLQQRSKPDRRVDNLIDPKDWSFGDLTILNSIESDLANSIKSTDRTINDSQQRVASIQSAQLKAEIKRDETWRFLRARKDASFAKLVHVRHLGPAQLENQRRLRRTSHMVRERMQELGDYLQMVKTTVTNHKMGRKGMQAPALDSIYRSAEHISILAHRRLDELEKLSSELQALLPKEVSDRRTREESVISAPKNVPSPLGTVQEMHSALPTPNQDTGKRADHTEFLSAMQKLIKLRKSPLLTKVDSEVSEPHELASYSEPTPIILRGRKLEMPDAVSAKRSPVPHKDEPTVSEHPSPKPSSGRPDFLATETPNGIQTQKSMGTSVFRSGPEETPTKLLQSTGTAQYTTFEGLVQPRHATTPPDLTLEQYVQQEQSEDEDDDEYEDEYEDEEEDEYDDEYEDEEENSGEYDEEDQDEDDGGES